MGGAVHVPVTAAACACGSPLEPWEVRGVCYGCDQGENTRPGDLRARREALGLSQAKLARRLGVTQPYISAAESSEGYANLRYDLALRCIEYEARTVKLPSKRTRATVPA